METTQLAIVETWKLLRSSWLAQSSNLFFIDLEFSTYDIRYEILEICVADVSGRIILNTTIDYGLSTRKCAAIIRSFEGKQAQTTASTFSNTEAF
jgi:hypothetical protein